MQTQITKGNHNTRIEKQITTHEIVGHNTRNASAAPSHNVASNYETFNLLETDFF
jgi:hypothetical protein